MPASVSVAASARLHLGFLDMNGGLGRKFGGVGMALDAPATRLTLTRADKNCVEGPESIRAAALLERAQEALGAAGRHRLTIEAAIPAHAGLGSGTQLALAISAALRRLEEQPHDPIADAALMARGARSGLGAGLFQLGGVVVTAAAARTRRRRPSSPAPNFPTHGGRCWSTIRATSGCMARMSATPSRSCRLSTRRQAAKSAGWC